MKNISNKYDPFERKIKKALDKFEVPYNPADWASMDAMLNKKHKKRALLFFPNHTAFTASVGVAIILVGLLMGWNLYVRNFMPANQQNMVLSQQNIPETTTTTNSPNQAKTAPNVMADKAQNLANEPQTDFATNLATTSPPNNNPHSNKHTSVGTLATNTPEKPLVLALTAKKSYNLNNSTSSSQIVVAQENSEVSSLSDYAEPIAAANKIVIPNLAQDDKTVETLLAQNVFEKHVMPAYLPNLAAQNIKALSKETTIKAPLAQLKAPQTQKKRFLAGLQTAFTQTFTNKSAKTNYATALGLSAEYKLTPYWAVETGVMVGNNVVNFASPIPIVSNDFHSPKITNVESKQIEIPLLIKHYFRPEARTQAYISAGTAFVHQSDVAYNIYVPTQAMLDVFTCNCNSNLPSDAQANEIDNNTKKVVQPKLAINNRFDWIQVHSGLQYQLNKNIVLQADASIKTSLKLNSIYDENAKNNALNSSDQFETRYPLTDKYRTTTTSLQLGVLYRF